MRFVLDARLIARYLSVVAVLLWTLAPGHATATFGAEPPHLRPADPPRAPEEFRHLSTAPLSEAVEIWNRILVEDTEAAIRRQLADAYERAGFLGAGRFAENAVRILEGRRLLLDLVENPIAWSATEADVNGDAYKVARRVADLTNEFEVEHAIDLATAEIERNGASQHLAAEWSYAVLNLAVMARDKIGDDALEVAIRIHLTGLEEKFPRPLAAGLSRAGGYKFLAGVFGELGDEVSALTAACMGRARLADEDIFETLQIDGVARRLEQELDVLVGVHSHELAIPSDKLGCSGKP